MDIEQHMYRSNTLQQLINDALEHMESIPLEPLPPETKFSGGGVYALYYIGKFDQYNNIYSRNQGVPIYVGKAVPAGWRQGKQATKASDSPLFRRLNEHARSISAAANIDLCDFRCKFMILNGQDADLISTIEAALTRRYNPLWNSYIDGFGNHDPGKGRYQQARSEWDVLHPGRIWADRLSGDSPDISQIEEKIGNYNVDKPT